MAAEREVIREFLVSLGFQVSTPDARKFRDILLGSSKLATQASAAIIGVAAAAEAMVGKFASSMERFYYASQRTKASVVNLQALEFAGKQIGLTADAAASALEGMAREMRTNPGKVGLIESLIGESTQGADSLQVLLKLVGKLGKMPFALASQYGETLGIPSDTLFQILANEQAFRDAIQKRIDMQRESGFSSDKAAAASREYMNALRGLWEQVELLGGQIAVVLLPAFKEFNAVVNEGLRDLTAWVGAGAKIDLGTFKGELHDIVEDVGRLTKMLSTKEGADPLSAVFWGLKGAALQALHVVLNLGDAILALSTGQFGKAWDKVKEAAKNFVFSKEGVGYEVPYNPFSAQQPSGRKPGPWKLPTAADLGLPMRGENGAPIGPIAKPFALNLPTMADLGIGAPSNTVALDDAGVERLRAQREAARNSTPSWRLPQASDFGLPSRPSEGENQPLGLSQNNPGNLRSWGNNPISRGFAQFKSVQEGLSAMAGNLVAYANRGNDTIRKVISAWAPSTENDTGKYISDVVRQLGIDPDQKLNLKDPQMMSRLMDAMIRKEQGFQPFGAGELLDAAKSRLGGGAGQTSSGVILHQKTDIHVTSPDPRAAAAATAAAQAEVNAELVRNFSGATR